MLCINCIKYKHGTFWLWRHRIFYDPTKNKPRSARYASVAARSRPGIIAGATGGVSRVWILRFIRNTQKLSRWSIVRKKCLKFSRIFSRIDELIISCVFSRSTVPSSLHLDCAFPRSRSRSLLGNGLSMDIHKVWVSRWVLKTTVEKNQPN